MADLRYRYSTSNYYDVSVSRLGSSWKIDLSLKPFRVTMDKGQPGKLFEDHILEPRVFAALQGER
ncbi:MAG TPA: hypothetical protein VEH86_03155, partial [Candidatus Acidoferrum sp.]|nr:hypothetical protein [Candidatus Acidoferrum sp.]